MRELKHYGVLGMRWGQRKARTEQSTSSSSTKSRLYFNRLRPVIKTTTRTTSTKFVRNPTPEEVAQHTRRKGKLADLTRRLFTKHTSAKYDKNGNDVSTNPMFRIGKKKGQSDKAFDAEFDAEVKSFTERKVKDIKKSGFNYIDSTKHIGSIVNNVKAKNYEAAKKELPIAAAKLTGEVAIGALLGYAWYKLENR